jgi:DNA-binding IclR family transcriptional regulator
MRQFSAAPAADHVLALLAQLARHPEPMAASTLASGLGLPRSTTYRLLGVLESHGLVVQLAEERRYGLGVGVYELGSAYQRQAPLQRIARPALHRLVDQTAQNAHLAVLHGRDVLYLIEERAVGRPLLVTDVGVRLPAALTASGLAMLARLPGRQVRALFPDRSSLVQRNGRGPTSPMELRRLLIDVRARGFGMEAGSVTEGLSSIAHAVLDHTGHPVAAVAITYDEATVDDHRRAWLVERAAATADQLSRRLGGRPLASQSRGATAAESGG